MIDIKGKWLSRLRRLKTSPIHFIKEFYYWKFSSTGKRIKSQDLKEFFNEITNFISNYNVNSMKVGEEYIWPYLRNHIWIQTSMVASGKAGRKYLNPIAIQNGHYKQVPVEFRLRLKYLCDAYEIDELDDKKSDFLFFINTNGTEETTIDSKIYHRIIDPFYEVAQKLGKAQKFEIVKSTSLEPSKWKKYYHKSKLIFFKNEKPKHNKYVLTYDKDMFTLIKQYIASVVLNDESHLNAIVDYELHVRQQYIDLLQKINPKVVCLHGFHYQAPLISAADELGILTVDLQHGIQVGWNPLYNNHDELPDTGYQAYPDYFAVWGKKEYNNILKTFKSSKHKPICMGNPWLEKIEEFLIPLSDHLAENIKQFNTIILIIMQNQTKIPKLFLEIIEKTNDDTLWIIRHHPKGEKYKARDFSNRKNILLDDEIDKILFNELFKYVDIAISEGSTLALEASHYGVHNIITSKMGLENYRNEIDTGLFHYLDDASEFEDIINKTIGVKKLDRLHAFEDIDTKEFLQELLRASKDKKMKYDSGNSKKI